MSHINFKKTAYVEEFLRLLNVPQKDINARSIDIPASFFLELNLDEQALLSLLQNDKYEFDHKKIANIMHSAPPPLIRKLFQLGDGIDGKVAIHIASYFAGNKNPKGYDEFHNWTEKNLSPQFLIDAGVPFEALIGIDFDAKMIQTNPALDIVRQATGKLNFANFHGGGSGVYIGNGLVFTAEHVVNDRWGHTKSFQITFPNGETKPFNRANVVDISVDADRAIIYLPERPSVKPVKLAEKMPAKGQPIYSFGYGYHSSIPLLTVGFMHHSVPVNSYDFLNLAINNDHCPTLKTGAILCMENERELLEWIEQQERQHVVAAENNILAELHIFSGYSGGPVVNEQGELIGVNIEKKIDDAWTTAKIASAVAPTSAIYPYNIFRSQNENWVVERQFAKKIVNDFVKEHPFVGLKIEAMFFIALQGILGKKFPSLMPWQVQILLLDALAEAKVEIFENP